MLAVRRLLAVGTLLSLIAVLATSQLWGQPGRERGQNPLSSTDAQQPNAVPNSGDPVAQAQSLSRFADRPLVLYRTEEGETLMALQVKPRLEPVPGRPRDYLILIDTAAHMAQGQLRTAQNLTRKLVEKLGPEDQLALWTVNTRSHDLSKGFQPAGKLANSVKKLDEEYPAGATNLKDGLREAINSFSGKEDRQRVIIFLGSGQSIAGPIDADLRTTLCKDMVKNQIAFYSVPLGAHMEPYNLHGFANGTGGKVVRVGLRLDAEKWTTDLLGAVAQPVLYSSEIKMPAEVAEFYPTTLPPLRPDVPTLVVGKLAKPAERFDYTVTGKAADKDFNVPVTERMPVAEPENFFLVNMVEQWKAAKDRPALLQADRALAYAFERNQMARADLVAQAEWAMEKNKFDIAERLFKQALKADPTSARAKAGLQLAEDLRSGKKSLDDVKKMIAVNKGDTVTRIIGGRTVKLPAEELFAQPPPPNPQNPPLAPDQADQNRLNEINARLAVADQEQTQVVNDAIRRANQLVLTDPDAAHEFLKRTLDGVRTNPDITNRAKATLGDRLERGLQQIDIRGAVVKRDQAEALSLLASANARTTLTAQERLEQNRVRERMRVFHTYMDQAREQQAYLHAQNLRKDLVDQGLPVPPAVTAAYQVGLAGYHLREEQELRRIRQERWLAVLLQVEKSHVPFPDEPPVEFPPPAAWKALAELRKAKYESTTFGADMPPRGIELQQLLSKPVKFPGLDDPKITLSEALEVLAKRYNLSFDINDKAFKFENVMDVAKTEVATPNAIPEMHTTLSTVLRKILARIPVPSGATYIIRRDVIEITTGTFAGAEKTVRVYPVADLVTPIPNAVNFSMLQGSATLFGLSAGALGGFAGIGGLRGIGAVGLGGGLGGLGLAGLGGGVAGLAGLGGIGGLGLGGNLGGLGGIGGIAGLGGGGFNQLGAQGGFQGNFQGQANLGVGGGIVGFGGQQLGQFGNLGGQFGLQGGNQSQILITLIRQVVGKPKDWAIQFDPITGQPLNPLDDNQAEGLNQENNQLGFYPPAQALAVKASSTFHTRPSNLIVAPGAMGGMGALPVNNRDALAAGNRDPKVRVAGQGDERPDDKDPKKNPALDPRSIWQEALTKGVDNPSLIIATADHLVLCGKFDHAAEFLKASLRQGIVTEPWVYKSLALALRMSGGATEDIERAEVSTADLEPKDAQGYLQAAQALAQDEKYGLALAFCRQAALLEPGTPHAYADALNYAELARDAQAMEWAAGNLLSHDWPVHNKKLQDRAVQKMESLVKLLEKDGRKDEAERLVSAIALRRQRDLVIQLRWQGDADLDLKVIEPTGSVCWSLARQTVGGGVLIGDSLADMTSETYLAAEAFPGVYQIDIEKVYGHPLGGKCQVKIIRHQGTPDETEQLLTVELKSRHAERISLKVDDGRRKETAYVAPRELHEDPEPAPSAPQNPDKVLHQLRVLADPEVTGVSRGFNGAVATSGQPTLPSQFAGRQGDAKPLPDDRTLYQTRVKPFVQNAMDVTAQAVISADRRYVRLSMTPMFNTVTGVQTIPVVVNPTIPGIR
jgi:tetratricopeptide (TPR) repeat protein